MIKLGFLAYHLIGSKAGQKSFSKNYLKIERVITDLIEVTKNGSLIIKKSDLAQRKKIFPMVQNQYLSSKVTASFLSSKEYVERAVKKLIDFLINSGYTGLNLDLEGVKKNTKSSYNFFVGRLTEQMKKNNLKLELSLPAKTENHIDTGWAGAYDYNYLGSLSNNIFIMAYDYHWAGGIPGPIAPLNWVYNVIDYVLMEIPPEKVIVGLPGYGYDWIIDSNSDRAKGLSYNGILNLLERENSIPEWDQESKTPYFKYKDSEGIEHEVWFENKASLREKIYLIDEFQVKGAALWRLGLEDSGLWDLI